MFLIFIFFLTTRERLWQSRFMPVAEYEAALEASNVAYRTYRKVADAYQAREIDDEEFFAARKAYEESVKTYDAAATNVIAAGRAR